MPPRDSSVYRMPSCEFAVFGALDDTVTATALEWIEIPECVDAFISRLRSNVKKHANVWFQNGTERIECPPMTVSQNPGPGQNEAVSRKRGTHLLIFSSAR